MALNRTLRIGGQVAGDTCEQLGCRRLEQAARRSLATLDDDLLAKVGKGLQSSCAHILAKRAPRWPCVNDIPPNSGSNHLLLCRHALTDATLLELGISLWCWFQALLLVLLFRSGFLARP